MNIIFVSRYWSLMKITGHIIKQGHYKLLNDFLAVLQS